MEAYDLCEPRMVRLAIDEMKNEARAAATPGRRARDLLARTGAFLWRGIGAAFARWQASVEQQRAYGLLQHYDDRALADIGLSRWQVLERMIAASEPKADSPRGAARDAGGAGRRAA